MFRDLTYRYKIPIRGTLLILITATAVASALIYRAAEDLRDDVITSAEGMSRVLARTLVPPLRRDDVWTAYEIVTSPLKSGPVSPQAIFPETILVLDDQQRVFVTTEPRRFPLLRPLSMAGAPYPELQKIAAGMTGDGHALETDAAGRMHMLTPIVSDGIVIGTLVVTYPGDVFEPRFASFAARAAMITLLVLAILVPVSWYWGVRMAQPLVQLAHCLGKIGPNIPADLSCSLVESKDELGRVSVQFQRMLGELKEKQALERQMIAAERLAAIGRLSAGIAHEINNPLGGMLNAINTYRRYGTLDDMAEKTVSLLERGVLQIRDTVSALLVEARTERRPLTPADLEDVRMLVGPALQKKSARLDWENHLEEEVALSSTLVRQVVINLLLNAAHAVPVEGVVRLCAVIEAGCFSAEICNDGEAIAGERIRRLFEPFVTDRPDGTGLGLWVSYQITQQLGGDIRVNSEPGCTCFTVTLPVTP